MGDRININDLEETILSNLGKNGQVILKLPKEQLKNGMPCSPSCHPLEDWLLKKRIDYDISGKPRDNDYVLNSVNVYFP